MRVRPVDIKEVRSFGQIVHRGAWHAFCSVCPMFFRPLRYGDRGQYTARQPMSRRNRGEELLGQSLGHAPTYLEAVRLIDEHEPTTYHQVRAARYLQETRRLMAEASGAFEAIDEWAQA